LVVSAIWSMLGIKDDGYFKCGRRRKQQNSNAVIDILALCNVDTGSKWYTAKNQRINTALAHVGDLLHLRSL
jgi:hypothetical protein